MSNYTATISFAASDSASLVLNGIFGSFTIYLLFSLIHFEMRGKTGMNISRARFLRALCMLGTAFSLVHYWSGFASYFSRAYSNTCVAFGVLWLLTYSLGILVTYIFLWTRQHTINTNPSLSYLNKRSMKMFSIFTLVMLLLGIVMVFLAGSRLIFFSNCSEHADSAKLKLYTIILSGVLLALTVIGQTQLLALFLIPLINHRRKSKEVIRKPQQGSRSTRSSDANMLMIRRCVFVAIISVLTETLAAIVTIAVEHAATKLVYDFNLLVNIACCVLSFHNWKQMIIPSLKKDDKTARSSSMGTEQEIATDVSSTKL